MRIRVMVAAVVLVTFAILSASLYPAQTLARTLTRLTSEDPDFMGTGPDALEKVADFPKGFGGGKSGGRGASRQWSPPVEDNTCWGRLPWLETVN
jgi:hypothetical protein